MKGAIEHQSAVLSCVCSQRHFDLYLYCIQNVFHPTTTTTSLTIDGVEMVVCILNYNDMQS